MSARSTNSPLENQPDLNEVLLSWKSPSHPFKKRSPVFYQTVGAITFLLVVIVFFLHEFMLVGVILSVAFVVYALSSVPPVEVEHKLMPAGIDHAGRLYRWFELYSFWFEQKWGFKMLVIQTRLSFPAQIRVVANDVPEQKVKDIIGKYLIFMVKPPKSVSDKFSDWLGKKIPLEATD